MSEKSCSDRSEGFRSHRADPSKPSWGLHSNTMTLVRTGILTPDSSSMISSRSHSSFKSLLRVSVTFSRVSLAHEGVSTRLNLGQEYDEGLS